MPPNNRLAPPVNNALTGYVPMPADPNVVPPVYSRFGPADYAQNLSIGVGEGLTSRLKSAKQAIQDPIQAVREAAASIRQMYDDPMLALQALRQLRQQVMSGPIGMGQAIGEMAPVGVRGAPTMRELDVYQGSRHRFEPTEVNPLGEFDASKIGTGEGAQAYGHGSYLAESPLVAKGYMRAGGGWPAVFINGKQVFGSENYTPDAGDFLEVTGKEFGEISGAKAKELALRHVPADIRQQYKDVPDSAFTVSRSEGNLYKADLPDEMIDRMLDWDKPLKEQPFKMQQAIFNDLADAGYSKAVVNDLLNRKTGMEFFKTLHTGIQQGESSAINLAKKLNLSEQEMFMDAPALASAVMRRMGIPGIKYLDAGSRGQGGSGTRNFVVFPGEEKKVRILERK